MASKATSFDLTVSYANALWGNLKCVSAILKNLVRYTALARAFVCPVRLFALTFEYIAQPVRLSAFPVRLSALTFEYIAQPARASVIPVRLSAFPVRLSALTFEYIAQPARASTFPVKASASTRWQTTSCPLPPAPCPLPPPASPLLLPTPSSHPSQCNK
ncbi:hypothetical protein NIES25_00960 [Nostoc linckia NIES-25]|nr:hypothetical protein NIES25_00960 [Nostoc linckia NIES-25]